MAKHQDVKRQRFSRQVLKRQDDLQSLLCVGLDPDTNRIPACCGSGESGIFNFCKAIVDATAHSASCYKPQIAYFAAASAEGALQDIIEYIKQLGVPVLLDGKRGDIGSTAEMYAVELFKRYNADATTVNPYMGLDSIQPYLDFEDRGIFVLCRTSNTGGADLQHLRLEGGRKLYEEVAFRARHKWNSKGNVGLVVGATRPEELAEIRKICGEMLLLLPGVGAQGADVGKLIAAVQGGGMLISSSRAILYAGADEKFAEAAQAAAESTRDEINRHKNMQNHR